MDEPVSEEQIPTEAAQETEAPVESAPEQDAPNPEAPAEEAAEPVAEEEPEVVVDPTVPEAQVVKHVDLSIPPHLRTN